MYVSEEISGKFQRKSQVSFRGNFRYVSEEISGTCMFQRKSQVIFRGNLRYVSEEISGKFQRKSQAVGNLR